MTLLEIRKKLLYCILQQNNFRFSEKILRESIPLIQNYLEKQSIKKKIKIPLPKKVFVSLKNEFRKIKYAYQKIRGGNQKSNFLEKVDNESIEIILNNEDFSDESQSFLQAFEGKKYPIF